MERLSAFGTDIRDVLKPTFDTYEPLLRASADRIKSVKKQTHSYGPHPRQQLDVYETPSPSLKHGRKPVLLFFYGGGLVTGHKTLPDYADDLCYANLASFFALEYGYTVIVSDYRLVFQHDATFPSGGEDVALTVQWILQNQRSLGPEPLDLFIMGNSAGGVHLSTFLLHSSFSEARAKVLAGSGTRLRGVIYLSVPFHFKYSHDSRAEINDTYFGDDVALAPLGLLKTAHQQGNIDFLHANVRVFILNGDLDPLDEIVQPRDDFISEWMSMGTNEGRKALAVDYMPGHNHISPVCAIGTGIAEEEAWGHQVGAFCENIRMFKLQE